MITTNAMRVQAMRQGLLVSTRCMPRVAISAASAIRRFYVPQANSNSSGGAHPQRGKPLMPDELLDKKHPKNQNETLASIIDGELDYDTDLGAVAVNNVVAERRAEARAKAAKMAKQAAEDLSKKKYS